MDEQTFTRFLDDQCAALADLDGPLKAWRLRLADLKNAPGPRPLAQDLQTRLDEIARQLSDAYMASTLAQGSAIRALVKEMEGLRFCLGIDPDLIRARQEVDLFRLALIYESIKDLGVDTRDATRDLDALCQAARDVGINPDPYLKEVASFSNTADHHGLGSMRALLFSRVGRGGPETRCPRCGVSYAVSRSVCPDCGAANPWRSAPKPAPAPPTAATPIEPYDGDPDFEPYVETEVIYLPTLTLFAYHAVILLGLAVLVLLIAQVVLFFIIEDYLQSVLSWVLSGITLAIWGAARYFRLTEFAKRYAPPDGKIRVASTWKQSLLIFPIYLGTIGLILFVVIYFCKQG